MKLICPTEELSKALQTVLRSVGARAGIPALSGVLMELDDTQLTLTTTDLELTTRVTLPVTGEAGKLVVPARYLADIVRNLPSDEVELFTEDGTVRIAGGRARYSLRSLPAEDFPRTEAGDGTREFSVPGDLLSQALSQVAPGASRDETRPVLTGVLFEGTGEELKIVATDSYRLALRTLPMTGVDGVKVLVPARAVTEAARLTSGGEVKISVGSSQIGFESGPLTLWSRLIEGEFPEYRKVIPESPPFQLKLDRTQFQDVLKRVAVLAHDAIHIFMELEPDRVRLQCQAQGIGEFVEEVDATYEGDSFRLALNPSYLEAGVSAVRDEQLLLDLTDPLKPVVVKGESDDFIYLLVPIRVS